MANGKAPAVNVAARAIELAKGPTISYQEMDCQAFVEKCVNDCGGRLQAAGSNDMLRNHAVWWGTLQNAKAEGKLVKGAGLLISEGDDESGLPAKYRGDGYGDFSHIGLYVGADALYDSDKNGNQRLCDVVHSSSSMGRVAGSTLKNGWTHVMWFKEIDYGVEVAPGVTLGVEATAAMEEDEDALDAEGGGADDVVFAEPVYAVVVSPNGFPVKMRQKPSTRCKLFVSVQSGETVEIIKADAGVQGGEQWSRIKRGSRSWHMMSKFLKRVSG